MNDEHSSYLKYLDVSDETGGVYDFGQLLLPDEKLLSGTVYNPRGEPADYKKRNRTEGPPPIDLMIDRTGFGTYGIYPDGAGQFSYFGEFKFVETSELTVWSPSETNWAEKTIDLTPEDTGRHLEIQLKEEQNTEVQMIPIKLKVNGTFVEEEDPWHIALVNEEGRGSQVPKFPGIPVDSLEGVIQFYDPGAPVDVVVTSEEEWGAIQNAEIREEETYEVHLSRRTLTVEGKVTGTETGRGLNEASIRVYIDEYHKNMRFGPKPFLRATTGPGGRFELQGVPTDYDLLFAVNKSGYEEKIIPLNASELSRYHHIRLSPE